MSLAAPKGKRMKKIVPILLILTLLGVFFWAIKSDGNPDLPEMKEVVSITATIEWGDQHVAGFEIPESDWEAVLSSMRMATQDKEPAKWEVAGHMEIDSNSGESVFIWIYYTQDKNAFSIEYPAKKRVYYRSLNSNATFEAVRKSYLNSKDEE